MSDSAPVNLEKAINELLTSDDAAIITQSLATISEASANLELRPFLQDASLFRRLLDIYATTYSQEEPPKELLRSMGNLVSDNETNRTSLIGNSDCIRQLKSLLQHYTPSQLSTYLEDFAVKIFFNLCNESPEVQQEAIEQGIHGAVLNYISSRIWGEEDEILLSISTSLLVNLFEQKNSVPPSTDRTAESVQKVLSLPLTQHLDSDAFLDVLGVVSAYLQDETFTQQTVQNKQVHLVFDILVLTEKVMRRGCDEGDEEDVEDMKQYRNFLNAFAQSLADLSSLPAFNDAYTIEDEFIKDLCRNCMPSERIEQQTSLAPGCACLILGNLAVTDEVSLALASGMVPTGDLLKHLGGSNDSVFLNAAAGLLRHLAIPMNNRELLFEGKEPLRQVMHLYTDVTLEQVQIAGLQLTRQILTSMPERTRRLIDEQELPSLTSFTSLFTQTTSTATKLEVSRLLTIILRTLQSPSSPGLYDVSLRTLINTPDILSPAVFAIKQPPSPGAMTAQAEAWLALNLFARAPGGAAVLAAQTSDDEELFSLLRHRIVRSDSSAIETVSGSNDAPQDTRPEWVREKERDNALVLVHDILKAEDVDDGVKRGLKSMLQQSDIRIG